LTTPSEELERIRKDPIGFIKRVYGEEIIGKQNDMLAALARPGVTEVHVKACHAPGKTHSVARAVTWFLACWPHDSIVLTTAPTWPQVEHQIWREIRDGFQKAKVNLGGRPLNFQWEIGPKWYALGITTSPETAVNIQGYHAAHVLIIVDEADGVSQRIWDAVDGLTTSAHVVVLAVGNPINAQSAWRARYEFARNDPRAVCITITADDVLKYSDTGKYPFLLQRSWVEDKKRRWGEMHPMYIAKVLAEWPEQSADTLIPMAWLQRARFKTVPRGPLGYGADIARGGLNRTVRHLWAGNQSLWSRATTKEDTMETASRIYADLGQYAVMSAWVDDTGLGGGVVDRLKQLERPVTPVNNGSRAMDDRMFENRGSEMWWNFRTGLEGDHIGLAMNDDPAALDELIADLARPKYRINGRRIIVDKYGLEKGRSVKSMTDEEMANKSPDRGDAAVLGWNSVMNVLPNRVIAQPSEMDELLAKEIQEADPTNWVGKEYD
jgi:hypothetical protein